MWWPPLQDTTHAIWTPSLQLRGLGPSSKSACSIFRWLPLLQTVMTRWTKSFSYLKGYHSLKMVLSDVIAPGYMRLSSTWNVLVWTGMGSKCKTHSSFWRPSVEKELEYFTNHFYVSYMLKASYFQYIILNNINFLNMGLALYFCKQCYS